VEIFNSPKANQYPESDALRARTASPSGYSWLEKVSRA
jgi:hypothetical protein